MSDETTTTTWSDLIAGIRRLGIAGDSMPLRRKIVPDDSQPVPTCGGRVMDRAVMTRSWLCSCGREVTDEFFEDAAIVPKFDHVAPHVEDGSFRGEWREPWPSTAGKPMHVMSVRGPTIVIDDGVSITGGPNPPASVLLADSALGGVDSHTLPLPLPEALNRPGRLVRDDAACGWRFEPDER